MALESASYVYQLVDTNPTSGDSRTQGDDHLRLIKTAVKAHLDPLRNQTIIAAAKGYLYGMTLSNNASDATNDIDIASGVCVDSTGVSLLVGSALTKRLDAAWSAGTDQGGLDTGAIANTTYHVFAIKKDSDATVDYLFSTSATSPTMPVGYTYFRRIGSILRESAAIVGFVQDGDYFRRKTGALDVNVTGPSSSAATRTLSVPIGIKVIAFGNIYLAVGATDAFHLLSDLDATDTAPSSVTSATLGVSSSTSALSGFTCRTNTSAQIRGRHSNSNNDVLRVVTQGWMDTRGRT